MYLFTSGLMLTQVKNVNIKILFVSFLYSSSVEKSNYEDLFTHGTVNSNKEFVHTKAYCTSLFV